MRRIVLLTITSLLCSTAVFAAPPGQGGSNEPECGQQGQPACDQTKPKGDKKDRSPRDRQEQPPRGQQEQPPGHSPGAQPPQPPIGEPQSPAARRRPPYVQQRPPVVVQPPPPVVHPPGFRADGRRWSRGDRLPPDYRQDQYFIQDWRRYNLAPPPRGYRWYCRSGGHCFLVQDRTGVIRDARWRDDRERYWRRRYSRTYYYDDDIYYRECRGRSDPAGVLIGGLIGGLLGGAASGGDRDGAVFAGIIIGASLGAALTRDMDCDDRSYAYQTYYYGLNSGRPGVYRWRNPHNNHRGDFRVRSYYYDPDGFYCANYRHTAWLDRRRLANGRACRQPDGAWAFLN